MFTPIQVEEIKEHLEKAQNPIFYYDNDADGLCSFVIFRRFLGRGKGVAVRSFPDLNGSYARKAQELGADYVFVLDKPVLSKEFVEEIDRLQLPLVWIDHHQMPIQEFEKEFTQLYVYNPARNKGEEMSSEPITYWAYKLTRRKEDLWLAIMGCVADHYLPDFASEFEKEYPEFWGPVRDPFDAYYRTEIGRTAVALNFGLKDSVTHVVQLQNFLISCKGPGDVLQETPSNYAFRKKYSDVKKKYDDLIKKAKQGISGSVIFFEYGGELSISSDIANELSYFYPNRYIVVAYRKDAILNISIRGKNVKQILENVFKEVEGSGGGHDDAVGARINSENLEKFKETFEREIEVYGRNKN
ncbi:MAG: DHHA1 domain-containing protein [Nanoarchaeota archaeon]|nr:DHHA1 domain-containing protein [Nanoarchaeota archaeon]